MSTVASAAPALRPPAKGWPALLAWGLVLALLAGSRHGAGMLSLDLWRDAANMAQYASGFFPPDFRDWRRYLQELLVTLQIAVWGTALALDLLSARLRKRLV